MTSRCVRPPCTASGTKREVRRGEEGEGEGGRREELLARSAKAVWEGLTEDKKKRGVDSKKVTSYFAFLL